MKTSAIGWTDFSGNSCPSLNFVTGCTPVSAGCKNCYAKAIYDRFGRDFTPTFYPEKLEALVRQRFPPHSPKRGAPHKPMAFICDTGDLFHEAISAEAIISAWEIMAFRKDVIWQVLTKRPRRMAEVLFGAEGGWYLGGGDYNPNIWLGVSIEDQRAADERVPILIDMWTGTTFVSVEPALGPVELDEWFPEYDYRPTHEYYRAAYPNVKDKRIVVRQGIDWVIVGAESGPRRRPFDVAWATDLYRQCQEADVPFFGKQGSGLCSGELLLIDGRVRQEWPR